MLETFVDLPRVSGPLFATSENEKHYGACSSTMGVGKVATVVHYMPISQRGMLKSKLPSSIFHLWNLKRRSTYGTGRMP